MNSDFYNGFTYPLVINDYNRNYFEQVKREAEAMKDEKINALSYSTFKLFREKGSREEYESEYMHHRKMLCAFTAMVLTEQGDKWMDRLCDIIWAVCDEFTWVLPAHVTPDLVTPEQIATGRIDLFAAETALALGEIYHLLGDKLPAIVRERIEYELNRRIIAPYLKTKPRFGIQNWSAVCGSGVVAAFVYLNKMEELELVKDNIKQNLRDFLDSFPEDGCCLEGALYWFYGFSHFVFAAEILRQFTDGEMDYFKDEKVTKIAHFCNNMYLADNYCISFSDSPHTYDYDLGIMCFLSKKYDGITVPDLKYAAKFSNDARYRFGVFIRNLYWACETPHTAKKDGYVYYDGAKWYINHKFGYSFAAKAGHNKEPHNHNDVGAFLLFENGKYIIDDIGWARYDSKYFGPERYNNICASSLGHSVPIVGGNAQEPGLEHFGTVTGASENKFSMDYETAYGVSGLEKLSRKFELTEKGVIIKESAKYDGEIAYRFVTRIKPEISGGEVHIDNYVLSSKNKAEIKITPFEFEPRFGGFGSELPLYTAYKIDFVPENKEENEFYVFKAE